jgi:transcriptional regulator with XRE-family HTH domain
MQTMVSSSTPVALASLGARLRANRLARNEPQARFAARLGISVPTLRRMERGDPAAQIGHWLAALDILGRAGDLDGLLAPSKSLFDAIAPPKARQRARRRS